MQSNGLGQLVDGFYGTNDLKKGWVGFNVSHTVLTFKFSKLQSFRAIVLQIRTFKDSEKLLQRLEIKASRDGEAYFVVRQMANVVKRKSDNELIVNINVYVAKSIKCILVRNNKDVLLVSEVSFLKGKYISQS